MAVQPALSRLAQLVNQPPQPVLLVQLALTLSQLVQTLLQKSRVILMLTTSAMLPI